MLTAIVLVCSVALSVQDCGRDRAHDVLQVPEEFSNPFTCLQHGQAFLASTQIGRDLSEDARFWVGETGDAITGDVFLQLCLLGEVVYG
jgi:hypothetical protein